MRTLHACLLLAVVAACESPTEEPTPASPTRPSEPAPSTGAVVFRTLTTGVQIDADGYSILAQHGSTFRSYATTIGANDSVLIKHSELGAASSLYVQLRGVDANCWVALPNVRHIPLRRDEITRVEYVLDCISPDRLADYDRVTAHHPGTISFHGDLSERYVWRDDGRFRLRYNSSRYGAFEYLGTYTRNADGQLDLAWDGDGRWAAKATIRGDTLSVAYNDIMWMSDFEPGVFVQVRSRR